MDTVTGDGCASCPREKGENAKHDNKNIEAEVCDRSLNRIMETGYLPNLKAT
jgi:hypothetical protein